tara:strand:+ start:1678 stop:1800 length:123 start_codon:yes stop_codon:yes gene_type:complete
MTVIKDFMVLKKRQVESWIIQEDSNEQFVLDRLEQMEQDD